MRLINVKTLQLSEFFTDEIPPYAILSHRWGREEVGFEIFSASLTEANTLHGFKKIQYCVTQAPRNGLGWCWVDTCCIDKRSSSELSEAINSMYQWYENAACCYVYLEDVGSPSYGTKPSPFFHGKICKSEWFLRGWTLQELIAPRKLLFYSREWVFMGSKQDISSAISRHCGIDEKVLLGTISVDKINIAQRMRWASGRKTTRVEDMAYSLLGIFDVNMPLLYGEGQKAFIRLQEEIIKRSADQSIFSWIDRSTSRTTFRSLLAQSPAYFQHCQNVEYVPELVGIPYAVTNRGLNISLSLQPLGEDQFEYLAALNCRFIHSRKGLAVRLRRTVAGSNQFFRVEPYRLYQTDASQSFHDIYVPGKVQMPLIACNRAAGFKLNIKAHSYKLEAIYDGQSYCWMDNSYTIRFKAQPVDGYFMARILFTDNVDNSNKRLVVLVYNPQLVAVQIPAGNLCRMAKVIESNSSTGIIAAPVGDYNLSTLPSTQGVDWDSNCEELGFLSVETDKEIIGDEFMVTANIHQLLGMEANIR